MSKSFLAITALIVGAAALGVPLVKRPSPPDTGSALAASPLSDATAGALLLMQPGIAAAMVPTAPLPPQPAPVQPKAPVQVAVPRETPAPNPADRLPVRLRIPAIGLNDPVEPVGVTVNGEMAVPSGKTGNVGWYKDGTVPGDTGSAVMDAHVFAAFAKLHELQPGDSIYVDTAGGGTLHFIVAESKTYPLADVPLDTLFLRDDAKRLNLITCAGSLTPDHSTYDHRLVVYAKLAGA